MKKRHSVEQIIKVLGEVESGTPVVEVARRHNITEQTYYRWKQKYGGMSISESQRLKALEEENARLKRKVADLILENDVLKEINSKNF
jgi:putative transposase